MFLRDEVLGRTNKTQVMFTSQNENVVWVVFAFGAQHNFAIGWIFHLS